MTNKPKPGNIVVVTNPSLVRIYGKHCLVVSGSISISKLGSSSRGILVAYHGTKIQLRHNDYEITERSDQNCPEFCSDCNGTGKVMLFTSIVGCKCSTK